MKLTELYRLVFLLKGHIVEVEKMVHRFKDGFIDAQDFKETEKTVDRLKLEIENIRKEMNYEH